MGWKRPVSSESLLVTQVCVYTVKQHVFDPQLPLMAFNQVIKLISISKLQWNAKPETVLFWLHFLAKRTKLKHTFFFSVLITQCCYYLLSNSPAGDGGKTRESRLCWDMKQPGSALLFISPHYYPPHLGREVIKSPGWDRDECLTSLSWSGRTWVGGGWTAEGKVTKADEARY